MTRKLWTADEEKILRREFPHKSSREVAAILGRTLHSILGRATKLRLHKTAQYIRACLAQCGRTISSDPRSIAWRIPKGAVPPNKGLRRPGWFRGRMRETQFRKGHRPKNYLPIGTIKANSDGYLRIKVAEKSQGLGASDKAWEFVHKRVWEAAHGPIPKGHRIWWKDRDHTNCALENLELLSDREHMARTTIHVSRPPEVRDAILALNAVKSMITKKEKKRVKEQAQRLAGSPIRNPRNAQGQRRADGYSPREGHRRRGADHHQLSHRRGKSDERHQRRGTRFLRQKD